MAGVELNIKNYSRCLCPVCPVQRSSDCTASKRKKWLEVRKGVGMVLRQYHLHPEAYLMGMDELEGSKTGLEQGFRKPGSEETIEAYCSDKVGRSDCADLDKGQDCQCPDCAVWEDNHLGSRFYCLAVGGSA